MVRRSAFRNLRIRRQRRLQLHKRRSNLIAEQTCIGARLLLYRQDHRRSCVHGAVAALHLRHFGHARDLFEQHGSLLTRFYNHVLQLTDLVDAPE